MMKQINTPELEQFKQCLEHLGGKAQRNLNLFFDVKMFESETVIQPDAIIIQAFPKAQPAKAKFVERSAREFSDSVIDFFSHLESTNEQTQFKVAYEFLESTEFCIKFEQSKIWEYSPDQSSFDELYDFIGWGFTYLIVNEDKQECLVIHGGYID